jgi:hypothetical protein
VYIVVCQFVFLSRSTLNAFNVSLPGGSRNDTVQFTMLHTAILASYVIAIVNVGVGLNNELEKHSTLLTHELAALVAQQDTSRSTVYARVGLGQEANGANDSDAQSAALTHAAMGFNPVPADLSEVDLPPITAAVVHVLAQNAHDVWSVAKLKAGWSWGLVNDNARKLHADLLA